MKVLESAGNSGDRSMLLRTGHPRGLARDAAVTPWGTGRKALAGPSVPVTWPAVAHRTGCTMLSTELNSCAASRCSLYRIRSHCTGLALIPDHAGLFFPIIIRVLASPSSLVSQERPVGISVDTVGLTTCIPAIKAAC